MWLCAPEEESSLWGTEDRVFPSTTGQGSAGSGGARRWCFRQPLGGDSAEDAVVLQYVNFGAWRMGDLDRRRRWVLEAPLDVFLVQLKREMIQENIIINKVNRNSRKTTVLNSSVLLAFS